MNSLGEIYSLAISSDNKYVVSGGADDNSVKLFDLENKNELFYFKNVHQGELNPQMQQFLKFNHIYSIVYTPLK